MEIHTEVKSELNKTLLRIWVPALRKQIIRYGCCR